MSKATKNMFAEARRLIEECKAARAEMDRVDPLYVESPEDLEIEAAWDAAYKRDWQSNFDLAELMGKIMGGLVDPKVVRTMCRTKLDEMAALVAKAA